MGRRMRPLSLRISNNPLRGYKLDVFEGGIRVPFVVQWTGRLPANTVYRSTRLIPGYRCHRSCSAGVSLPADRAYDGLNLIPYLAGEQSAREEHCSGAGSV